MEQKRQEKRRRGRDLHPRQRGNGELGGMAPFSGKRAVLNRTYWLEGTASTPEKRHAQLEALEQYCLCQQAHVCWKARNVLNPEQVLYVEINGEKSKKLQNYASAKGVRTRMDGKWQPAPLLLLVGATG